MQTHSNTYALEKISHIKLDFHDVCQAYIMIARD